MSAVIAATVANVMGGGKSKAVPADFIPEWDRKPASADEMFRKVQALNAALGGTVQEG